MIDSGGLEKRSRWQDLGGVELGRPHLGPEVPVLAYRLLQYSLRDTIVHNSGPAAARSPSKPTGRQTSTTWTSMRP